MAVDAAEAERQQCALKVWSKPVLNAYQALGIPQDASKPIIQSAIRTISRLVHPDKHPEDRRDEATKAQQQVNHISEILQDDVRRAQYDSNMTANSGEKQKGPSGCCLFVYHVPEFWTEDDLSNVFAPFAPPGKLLPCTIFKDKITGFSKGFAFVNYDNATSANTAITAMNGFQVEGKRLRVEIKKPRGRAANGSAGVAAAFAQQQQAIQMGWLMQQNWGMPGMCAYSAGVAAGAAGVSAHTCNPYVYYSDPSMAALSSYKPIQAPPNACLFIYHLPVAWTDSDLWNCFAPFAPPGVLLKALVYKDRATGLSKGFGFVNYDNPMSAQNAIHAINGMAVDGKRLRVEIKKPKGASPY